MSFKMKIEGLPDVRDALTELSKSQQKTAVRNTLIDASKPMADAMAANAPVDEGELRDSIIRSSRIVPSQARNSRRPGRDEVRSFVGPNYAPSQKGSRGYAPHAHLVEFGTGPRYHKSGKFVGEAAPQPYARPAFDSTKSAVVQRIASSLLESVNKAVAKARRKKARGK